MPDSLIPGSGFEDLLNQVAVPHSNLISNAGFSQTVAPGSIFESEFKKSMGVAQNPLSPTFVNPFQIDTSGRFPLQVIGLDNEDIYAQGQGALSKAFNATLKGGALALTTFAQSTVGLLNGVASAIGDGKFSSFYDNEMNRWLDGVNKNLENQLPNYYSAAERNNPWYSNILTANFFWDKIVKNLGFMAGAAASGSVFANLLQGAKLAATGKALNALQDTEKAIASGKTLETLGQTASGFNKFLGAYNALNTGQRVLVAGLSTVGEAGIEALQSSTEFREKAIADYRQKNGVDPLGDALKSINDAASNVGNTTFALNTALLTASNYIQFPKLLGNSHRAERGMYSELVKKAKGVGFDAKTLSYIETRGGKFGKLFNKVRPYTLSVTEGLEEVTQYAVQTGSNNFWNKKYEAEEDMDLGFFEGAQAVFGKNVGTDLVGYGIDQAYSPEGQEQFFIGAVSGSIGKARGTFKEQKRDSAARQSFLQQANANNLSSYTRDTMDSVKRATVIAPQMEDAMRQGEVLEYKDLERDYIINYLLPKIKHGRMDLFEDEMNTYAQLAATPEGFKQLQDEGRVLPTDTRDSFLARLGNLNRIADSAKVAYQGLNARAAFEFTKDKDGKIVSKYGEEVIEKLTYASSKIMDYDNRIPLLATPLIGAGINTDELINDPSRYEADLKLIDNLVTINGLSVTADLKNDLKTSLTDVVELTLRRQEFIKEYDDMLSNPGKFQEAEVTEPEAKQTVTVTTKDGEENIEIGTEYYLGRIVSDTEEGFLSEKYPIFTILAKNADGSLRIKDASGTVRTIDAKELEGFKLGKVSDVRNNPKANFFMKNRNRIFNYKFKSGIKQGVLRWSPTSNELYFEYKENGKTRKIPVRNSDFSYKEAQKKGFKEPVIKATDATLTDITDADELGDQVDASKKLENRFSLISTLVGDSRKRLESIDKFISNKREELSKVNEALDNLVLTKAGIPRKKYTKAITKTLQELGETKGKLVIEIRQLEDEKDELQAIQPYFEDILQNYQELPDNTLELVTDLKQEVNNLEELIENTSTAIADGNSLIEKIDSALQTAYTLLKDFIRRVKEETPNVPSTIDQYQENLERFFGTQGAEEFIRNNEGYTPLIKSIQSDISDFTEELEITPNEQKINKLQEDIKELSAGLQDLVNEQLSKSKLLEFFEAKIAEERQRKAEEDSLLKNKALQDAIFTSQKQEELKSGDNNGSLTEQQQRELALKQATADSSRMKDIYTLASSTSGRSEKKVPDSAAAPSVIRERNFLFNQTYFPTRVKQALRGLTITANNESKYGLTGLVESIARQNTANNWHTLSAEDLKKVTTDPDNGVILVVYATEKDGEYTFLDENGKALQAPDINQVVASTLTSTSTKWLEGGDWKTRVRQQDQKIAPEVMSQWRAKRDAIIKDPNAQVFNLTFSRGIPVYNEQGGTIVQSNVAGTLFPASKMEDIADHQGAVKVITTDKYTHLDITYDVTPGTVYFEYQDVFAPLTNRQFTSSEQDTIVKVLTNLAIQAKDEQTLKGDLMNYLQGVLYWGTPKTKAGRNQIWIEHYKLNFGNSGQRIPFTPQSIEANKSLIKAYLSGTYNNINNHTLQNNFHDKFIEYYLEKDELKTKEHKNYQHFLFETNALKTPIIPTSQVTANNNRNFQQKYAILQGVEYSISQPAPQVQAASVAQPSTPVVTTTSTPVSNEVLENLKAAAAENESLRKSTADFRDMTLAQYDADLASRISAAEKAAPVITGISLEAKTSKGENIIFIAERTPEGININVNTKKGDFTALKTRLVSGGMTEEQAEEAIVNHATFHANKLLPQPGVSEVKSVSTVEDLEAELAHEYKEIKHWEAVLEKQPANSTAPGMLNVRRNNIKEINAKLDILRGTVGSPSQITVPKKDNTQYRVVDTFSVNRMSDKEKIEFNKFINKELPQFTVREAEHLIQTLGGKEAWGMLQGQLITLYKNAEKGTGYHEAFEGVWKYFVTPEEQDAILNEFKDRAGSFRDRVSQTDISYNEANDQQAKEELADEFAQYKAGKKITIGQRIKNFFDRIINFFRANKGYKPVDTLANELFDKIISGGFRTSALPAVLDTTPEYSSVPKLSEAQTHGFVQDITKEIFIELIKEGVDLFEPQVYERKNVLDKIRGIYASIIPGLPGGQATFEDLITRTKEFLKTFNIEFDENNDISINDENHTRNDYVNDKMTADVKKNSPFAIKYILSSLAKTTGANETNGVIYKEGAAVKGYELIPFARTFINLLETFEGASSIDDMIKKLSSLSKRNSDYIPLINMLGRKSGDTLDWNNLTLPQWRMLSGFYNTFNKQRPKAQVLTYNDAGEAYFSSVDIGRASEATKSKWESSIRHNAKNNLNLFIGYNKQNKNYEANIPKIKEAEQTLRYIKGKIDFLGQLGVDFDYTSYDKMNSQQRDTFANAINSIIKYLTTNKGLKVITGESLGISGPLTQLANLHAKVNSSQSESTFPNIEGEQQQVFVQPNFLSQLSNVFNTVETLEELYQKLPYLRTDPFAQNSEMLKLGGKFFKSDGERTSTKLTLGYTDGTKEENGGTKIADLDYPSRITAQINHTLEGQYYINVPADSSTEWFLEMGEFVDFTTTSSQERFEKSMGDIMINYLSSEIELAKQANSHKNIANVGKKAADLRFFKDILSATNLAKVNEIIRSKGNFTETQAISQDIVNYIKQEAVTLRRTLAYNEQLFSIGTNTYAFPGLLSSFAQDKKFNKNKLSEAEATSVINYIISNNIVANMEMHKIIFGDPYNFAIKDKNGKLILDETKRIKSFLSPAAPTMVSDFYNNTFNKAFNEIGNITLAEDTPGYYRVRNTVNTITYSDVNIASQYAKDFTNVNEADAQALHTLQMHRDLLNRHGQWGANSEAWYQWEMAFTRQELYKKGVFKNYPLELKNKDNALVKTPKPEYTLHIIKPIVRGIKQGSTFIDPILDKFSSAPITYSAVKGTNLENLFVKMFQEQVDYVIFESGRKVGATDKNSFYTESGKFNTTTYTGKLTVNWSDYSVQVENSYDKGKKQTRGSQITKLFSLDFFDGGIPVDFQGTNWSTLSEEEKLKSEIYKEVKWNNTLLSEMTTNGYENLLSRLGIEDTGTSFIISDYSKLYDTLERESFKRDMPENLKKVFKINPETKLPYLPLEASTEYTKIQKMLYSMVDTNITSPKVNGGPKTQLSVVGWESSQTGRKLAKKTDSGYIAITEEEYNALSPKEKKKVALTSDTLKFYTPEDPYIEILLPHWFKNKFKKAGFKSDEDLLAYLNSSDEGKRILKGIGFRIPTANMTSIEAFRVKGFLPQDYGDTIVLPSEITTKAGSDFDIDKLNTYLKNIYLDSKNNIKLVPFFGFGEEAKQKFKDLIRTDNLQKIFDISDTDYVDDTDVTYTEEMALQDAKNIDIQVDRMYEKSLENEYYESLERVITHPKNFDRLIQATDNETLPKLAARIANLTNTAESNSLTRLLSIDYLSKLRHAFIAGKKWVGIGAVNNTGHSQAQRTTLYIDTASTKLSQKDKEALGDGKINLPHNTDSFGRPLLSSILDKSKKYISDKLSWYMSAFVDVAKDPYILNIIYSRKIVGVTLMLERLGVPTETVALFMNQPIIREFVHYSDLQGFSRLANTYQRDQFLKGNTKFAGKKGTTLGLQKLEDYINDFYHDKKLSADAIGQQLLILDEFIKYQKMSDHLFSFNQSTNWDTARFTTGAAIRKKQLKLQREREFNIIKSPDNILDISNNGKIQQAMVLAKEAIESTSRLTSPDIRDVLNQSLDRYLNLTFISDKILEKIDSQLLSSFVDYLVQTKLSLNGKTIQYLTTQASTSVATRVNEILKDQTKREKLNNNPIFNSLKIQASNLVEGADNISISPFPKEVYEKNLITGYLNELRELQLDSNGEIQKNSLYGDLLKLALIQGTGNFSNLLPYIPIQDTSIILQRALGSITKEDAQSFIQNFNFERNLWKNKEIVLPFQPVNATYQFPTKFGTKVLKVSDLFNNKNGVTERPLITLERFHKLNFGQDQKTADRWDIVNNRRVSFNTEIKPMIEQKDFSFTDKIGYQKVFIPGTSTPLSETAQMADGTQHTYYYYKQVNLMGNGNIQEHYTSSQASAIENSTVKIVSLSDQEIVDEIKKTNQPVAPVERVIATDTAVIEGLANTKIIKKDCK